MKPDVHVVPMADLVQHVEIRQCWCRPRVDEFPEGTALVVHFAADGREYVEPDACLDERRGC